MDIWWSLHLRREPASVPLARHILLGTMASAGVDPEVSHEVGVALTEACANAVEHAGRLTATGQDSGFQVTAIIEDGCLRVEITDSGPGFSAATRIRPCVRPRARSRRHDRPQQHAARPAPALVRTLPARGDGVVDDGVADDDFAPFGGPAPLAGIPADAGSELPDLAAESGRGLFLIRALMDHVQFRNHPRSGAVVSFDKRLTYRDRPLLHAS